MNDDFGQFIKELRKKNILTQKELADQLNISDKAVSKWEVGDSYPDISLLIPISNIFNVTVDELLKCKYNIKERKGEITKNLIIFNIAANIILIIVIIVFLLITLYENNTGASIELAVVDKEEYIFISLITVLGLSILSFVYNLLQYKKIGSEMKK